MSAVSLLSIEQARAETLAATGRLGAEWAAIDDALDRVLADDLRAQGDVPAFRSAAMDGYALAAGPAGRILAVRGESRAGHPHTSPLAPGCAVRVSTGAVVPDGAEAVIRQEDVEERDGAIRTRAAVACGENVRSPGEDLRSGEVVLAAGTVLGPGELGAAVAAGAGSLRVACRPRATILCTGDELRAPGEPLGPGQIHNSNAPMLVAMARRCGALAPAAGRLPDDPQATRSALAQALAASDVVIVSGGVSVGPHDHVKPALAALGVEERFWGVALRPGKPTWFGTLGQTLVFGLPGNPVSAAVTFSLFVAPALRRLQGAPPAPPLEPEAVLAAPVRRNPQREQALRVRIVRSGAQLLAHPHERQDSHIVTSLLGADALALLAPGEGVAPAGARVRLAELVR
jgi:molybdopterin molybdotransferase